ncbi:class I SAM-dependent methyltransferase [Flavobacterium sp.]|jgi:16S rRNA G966 N2-methylase RsmD|uniref:THUMP-like domain-containing protein n=1 Tax=Flavobacterium sp. TaxID=239 RepID=UPI0037BE2C05
MNLTHLLDLQIQKFIDDNLESDLSALAFKKNPFPELDWKILLNQIETKAKAKDKLPTWFANKAIIYPEKISFEQTSSEITANYKSKLVAGNILLDASGGFGVDDYYFSKTIQQVYHCEMNQELSEIVSHNFHSLNVANCSCIVGNSTEILEKLNQKLDWIYVDPSRRNQTKGKVFMLKDCSPNVPALLDFYLKHTNNILIKTAPILDISAGLKELKYVKEIHVVAVNNEVKELLWILKKDFLNQPLIKAVNLTENKVDLFTFNYDAANNSVFGLPEKYLYEPNAAIMKSGGFSEVSNQFQLKKFHQHSHLYTSNELISFPGRVFEILEIINYSKIEMKSKLENQKSNITLRNFPDTVENIRKKWQIKDGGTLYSFFTTDLQNNKIVLLCKKN